MRDDVVASPNIWRWPRIYEVENRAQDPDDRIWQVIGSRVATRGRDVLDIGCGSGFHLPRLALGAASATGVEPHRPLVEAARARCSAMPGVRVLAGSAGALPLPDASVDVVHARTAYFFGRGCAPGLREADRVLRPGGTLVIVDLDAAASPYGDWMRADAPQHDPADVEAFFSEQRFESVGVTAQWRFARRADLESVLRIEFSRPVSATALRRVAGTELAVGYRVRFRTKPDRLLHR